MGSPQSRWRTIHHSGEPTQHIAHGPGALSPLPYADGRRERRLVCVCATLGHLFTTSDGMMSRMRSQSRARGGGIHAGVLGSEVDWLGVFAELARLVDT